MDLLPKILQLNYDDFGVCETFFEPQGQTLFYVLCDAIYLTAPEKNLSIAREFEKLIKQYILLHFHELSEKILRKAIEHAQNHFLKHYISYENQLKVAITILAEHPQGSLPNHKQIWIAGLGDIKIFSLNKSLQLLYYDPEIPQLPENLSLKKRFHYITNAIGVPDFKCGVMSFELHTEGSLLITTYGAYQQLASEKLGPLFTDFEQKKNQLHRMLNKTKEKEHVTFFTHIRFQKVTPQRLPRSSTASLRAKRSFQLRQKREKQFPVWILKIASVAIVSLMCLEFFNYYIHLTKASSYTFDAHDTPKSLQTNSAIKPYKKPLELPFLKERAYIIDLKEKYEKQSKVIKKLQHIVNEQDKALRDLQVKNFYQNETISAKSYRPQQNLESESDP